MLDRFDIVTCAILLLSYAAVGKLPFAPAKLGDRFFHVEAKILARAVRGVEPWRNVYISRAPAPVLYYAIPYVMVSPGSNDDSYWQAAFVWTTGWMLVSLLLIRRIGELLGGTVTGKLAVTCMLVTPFWVYYSYGILAEPPAFLGAALFTYGWLRWLRSGQGPSLRAEGVWLICTGMSLFVLCRPNALLLLGFALLAAASLYRTRTPGQVRVSKLTVAVVAMVSLVAAIFGTLIQMLPKHQQGDLFVWVAFQGGFQHRNEPWNWSAWDKIRRRGSADYAAWDSTFKELRQRAKESGASTSDLMARWLIDDVEKHPVLWARMVAVRALNLHISLVNSQKPDAFRIGPIPGQVFYIAFHVFVNALNFILLGGAFWFLSTNRGQAASYWPLWGPWLSLLLFHAIVYAEPRYLFPSRPGITVMAAAAFTPIVARVLARFQSRSVDSPPATIGAHNPAERSA